MFPSRVRAIRDLLPELILRPVVVPIDAGTFPIRGSALFDADTPDDQVVTMRRFEAGRYPVTVEEFREFFVAVNYWQRIAGQTDAGLLRQLLADRSRNNHPVVYVNHGDQIAYVNWLSERSRENWFILSAAQQEYIRRGSSGRIYPWGNDWREPPYFNLNRTAPVDTWSKGATPEGVGGIGIVWEATRSWVSIVWEGTMGSRRGYLEKYDLASLVDPEGPQSGGEIEVRGGWAWSNNNREVFSGALRHFVVESRGAGGVGFRVGREL